MRALVTGASSGIGLALARELGRRGYDVALLARRTEPMEGAGKAAIACDVTDLASVRDAVRRAEEALGGPIDLAVANAGISVPMHGANFKVEDAERIFRVNVLGMMYLFDAVIPSMVERRSGRFAGVASIAGLRGIPAAGPYSASKAAMQSFLEAARIELAPHGVGVTIVNPGFVATPLTEKNRFRMPFLMDAEEAARRIADGIEKGKRVVEFPWQMSLLMRTVRHVPDRLYDRIFARYGRRKMDAEKVKR
jgi:short-subunit dehydrogenase